MSAPRARDRAPVLWSGRRSGLKMTCAALLLALIAAEGVARYILGFGSPPLVLLDEEIEYYIKPSENYRRFGNRIRINAYGMRADDFPQKKAGTNELRLLVLGDSVVYGGHRVDQDEIATHLLPGMLEPRLGREVTVANIAASSWGPLNIEAYLSRFGTFDADAAIFVLSNHDLTDVPLFVAETEPYWTYEPWCALHDALKSIYERMSNARRSQRKEVAGQVETDTRRGASLDSTARILDRLEGEGIKVFIALHQDQKELRQGPGGGHHAFRTLARERGIQVLDLGPPFQASIEGGVMPYRDVIHPNPTGMRIMAEEFADAIAGWLDSVDATSPAGIAAIPPEAACPSGVHPCDTRSCFS